MAWWWITTALALNEEGMVRGLVGQLMVADDLKRPHLCDLVLDSNLDRKPEDYPGVEALLRPSFALVRAAVRGAARPSAGRGAGGPVRRLLVSLGLTDLGGITARVVGVMLAALADVDLDVALGRGAPSLGPLTEREARAIRA